MGVVEMHVSMGDDSDDESFDVMDTIAFNRHGKIRSAHGLMAAIVDRMPDRDQKVLIVKGLPPHGNDLYVYKVFAPFGALVGAYVDVNEDGTCAGTASVEFARATDAKKAQKALDGHEPRNKEAREMIAPSEGVVLHVT